MSNFTRKNINKVILNHVANAPDLSQSEGKYFLFILKNEFTEEVNPCLFTYLAGTLVSLDGLEYELSGNYLKFKDDDSELSEMDKDKIISWVEIDYSKFL